MTKTRRDGDADRVGATSTTTRPRFGDLKRRIVGVALAASALALWLGAPGWLAERRQRQLLADLGPVASAAQIEAVAAAWGDGLDLYWTDGGVDLWLRGWQPRFCSYREVEPGVYAWRHCDRGLR